MHKHLVTIVKNAFLGIGGKLFFVVIRFGIVIVITRTIGAEKYGIYVLVMTVITFVEAIALLGLQPAMIKFVSQYKTLNDIDALRGAVNFAVKATLVTSAVLAVAVFLLKEPLSSTVFHKPEMAPVLAVMALGVPFTSIMLVMLSALQGIKLVKHKILVQQLLMPVFRLLSILIAFFLGYHLLGVAWAWVLTAIFGFMVAITMLAKRIGGISIMSSKVERKKILSFSLPLLLSQLLYQNINTFSILIIGIFLPAAQAGVFGIARRTIPFVIMPLLSFNAIFSPVVSDLFTSGQMDELRSIYKTCSRWVLTLTLPVAILMFFFSKDIALVFGRGFSESGEILVILLIGQMVTVGTGSTALLLSMTGKPLYNLFNTGMLCAFNVALTLFLISRYGIIGAAWAQTISITLVQLLQMAEVWYLYRIQPYKVDHVKPLLAGGFSFLILLVLKGHIALSNHVAGMALLSAVALLGYVLFLLFTGLAADDRVILDKFIQRVSGKRRGAAV